MSYTPTYIQNGESGLNCRNSINSNFEQLFGDAPIQLENANETTIIIIPANTFIASLSIIQVSGTPVMSAGTSEGGGEILDVTDITGFTQVQFQQYFENEGTIWITWYNTDPANVRIDQILNYF